MSSNDRLAANPFPINEFHNPRKQKAPTKAGALLYLVPEIGIQPTTYAMRRSDLHQLLEAFGLKPSLDFLKCRSRSRKILMDVV